MIDLLRVLAVASILVMTVSGWTAYSLVCRNKHKPADLLMTVFFLPSTITLAAVLVAGWFVQ
jgi:hypothetical protein